MSSAPGCFLWLPPRPLRRGPPKSRALAQEGRRVGCCRSCLAQVRHCRTRKRRRRRRHPSPSPRPLARRCSHCPRNHNRGRQQMMKTRLLRWPPNRELRAAAGTSEKTPDCRPASATWRGVPSSACPRPLGSQRSRDHPPWSTPTTGSSCVSAVEVRSYVRKIA